MKDRVKHILNNPLEVNASDLLMIEEEREKYPYFYPFILLQTKATSNHKGKHSDRYVQKASVYATNRKILYDYLNFKVSSPTVDEVEKDVVIKNSSESKNLILEDKSYKTHQEKSKVNDLKLVSEEIITETNTIHEDGESMDLKNSAEIVEQIAAKKDLIEKNHSFTDWLKINKKETTEYNEPNANIDKKEEIEEKFKTIEAFLDKNPKIIPAKEYKPSIDISTSNYKENLSHLMTETLANIYVEQKKYDKAIKAYRILRLKYPEKSGYFADRIKEINELKN